MVHGRDVAIREIAEKLETDAELWTLLPSLSGARLICQCFPKQGCHADAIISAYSRRFPTAFDGDDPSSRAPLSSVLNRLAELRCEVADEEDSTADEGAPAKDSGWRRCTGPPMQVGSGHVTSEVCDGQSLASPSR